MNDVFKHRLDRLINNGQHNFLRGGLKGIEKESLRITRTGGIAQTPHPLSLGSALTHPYITTDYSEALLEFITPPFNETHATLKFLEDIHKFVYDSLGDELLWATSMPCGISGDKSIPIANYGSSNIGQMKHIYRRGLGFRYGRAMQVIAGIHFNYSVPESFWPIFQDLEQDSSNSQAFIANAYFGLIRNLKRYGWLILYLFSASPAICKSFLHGRKGLGSGFKEFDRYTLFAPYATSLRMSDIGYKSSNQANLNISYNNLDEYISSLTNAIETPHPDYKEIDDRCSGGYPQLNDNILQIENEYYSSVRPKQIAYSGEKPTLALQRRGVRYIELRSLDIGIFDPIGVKKETLYFIEALMLLCLIQDSPLNSTNENKCIKENILTVACRGREVNATIMLRGGESVALKQWALEICDCMQGICEILDDGNISKPYTTALESQIELIRNPEKTPSARILDEMTRSGESFAQFGLRIAEKYEHYFKNRKLNPALSEVFRNEAVTSMLRQRELEEASDRLPLDKFLEQYFAQ